jgi:single-strand DNA-binding protein
MNQCILMAEILTEPELRYTSENQTPISDMQVQFAGLRPEDPVSTLRVIGWGNLAQEIQASYHAGDRVIIEGRLGMNTIERPEGFKEKRAELTAQRIHRLAVESSLGVAAPAAATVTPAAASAGYGAANTVSSTRTKSTPKAKSPSAAFVAPPEPVAEPNYDEIPF